MSNNRMVYHDGQVISIDGGHARVRILSKSACTGCHAKGVCSAADVQEKIIDTVPTGPMNAGDLVTVVIEERLGWKAVFYGFFLPFVVMFIMLFTFKAITGSETEAALFAIASLFPYYLVLYLFRKKIEKDFIFRAEKKE